MHLAGRVLETPELDSFIYEDFSLDLYIQRSIFLEQSTKKGTIS
jgi:hypothetical protein